MALTVAEVIKYVQGMLGYPKVEVELEDSHFQIAFDEALRAQGTHQPKKRYVPFTVSAGTQVYDLSALDTGYGVIDVQYPPDEYLMNAEFDVFNPRIMARSMNLADYELGLVYNETTRKILGADFEWDFNEDTKVMMISPIPATSYSAVAVCLKEWTGSDVTNPTDKTWILKMCLAKCKQMLGEIRRKIRNVEGTENTFELDGAELIQEGIELENKLMEDIEQRSGDFVAPLMGD